MNPSAPFIQRPVATSLLMIAIVLVGFAGYLYLPLSALPEVDYPTIQVQTFLPGASPDVMTTTVTAPLERQFGQMPGPQPDVVGQFRRRVGGDAAIRSLAEPRHRRAAGAGGDQRLGQSIAAEPSGAADIRQGQSGGRADPHAGDHLQIPAADAGGGHGRHAHRPEDLAASGRRPGQHQWRPATGDPRAREPPGARLLRPQHRRSAHDDLKCQFERAQGQLRRRLAFLHDRFQRSALHQGRLQEHRRRLQERRAGASFRRRRRRRQRREQQAAQLDGHDARHPAQRPAPSPAPTSSPSPTASRSCCRRSRRDCPAASR